MHISYLYNMVNYNYMQYTQTNTSTLYPYSYALSGLP